LAAPDPQFERTLNVAEPHIFTGSDNCGSAALCIIVPWTNTLGVSLVHDANRRSGKRGEADERIMQPDSGYGFLWRLYSYWRFEEREEGTVVECRAISVTPDVPFGLGWAIEPIIQSFLGSH
jgi:hypothetical protein